MRLHLPKTLLAAVLAACAALPTWATITETPLTTLTVEGVTLPTAPEGQTTVYKQIVTDNEDSCGTLSAATATFLKSDSVQRFKVTDAATVANAGTLVIAKATADETLSNAGQLYLSRWSGNDIYSSLEITNDIIIGESNAGSAIRISDAPTAARSITLSGSITLAQNAQIGVDGNASFSYITGSVIGREKTLTIAQGSNSSSGVLNMGDGTTGKTLTLGGLTVANATGIVMNYETATIGTLTLSSTATNAFTLSGGTTTISTVSGTGSILLNGGTLKVQNTGDLSLSGIKFAGGVLDVSSVTGTLSITNSGEWRGDYTQEVVKVIDASNDTVAGNLVTSLTSDLSKYMYRVGSVDNGESASSVYRVRRNFITSTAVVDASDGRIVVSSVTGADGSTEFSNVGMSDLIDGDKVTISGLTGWIGQNGANTILADLKFTGKNHINSGSPTNSWITYSGAITGDGTLSYEWSGADYTYNFNGDLSDFTGTISDTTTLHVTIGGTPATDAAKAVNATIDIAGNLTVNRDATFTEAITVGKKLIVNANSSIKDGTVSGNMDLKSGSLSINGDVTLKGALDMKGGETTGGPCLGHLSVAKGGTLKVTGNIWVLKDTAKILLKEGGKLEWNGLTFTGKTAMESGDTGLTFGTNDQLRLNEASHKATNTTIGYSGTASNTLSWTLDGCGVSVSNGTLTVNGRNTNTALNVSGGSALFDSSTFTSLADSTVSGGIVKLKGYYTTLKGTLKISGGTVINTASGMQDGVEAPLKLGQNGKVVISGGSLENDGFTYTKTDTESAAGTNDASLELTNNATSGSLKVFEGDLKITKATMTKTEKADKGIGIALDSVTLVLGQDTKTTTLQKDGKTQNLSGVSVASGATLKVANTNATLGTVSGAGTVSTSVEQGVTLGAKADSTNAFTGTLEATAGQLNVTARTFQTLAGLKANGGNIDVINATSLSVTDMVIGDNATVGVYSGSDSTTESALNICGYEGEKDGSGAYMGSLTLGSGAKLEANLLLYRTELTFKGGALAMGSTLTLISGGSSKLLGVDLSTVTTSGLTLFTGVGGFSTGWSDTASADAVTIDDAHDIFGNLTAGAYSLRYTGGTDGDVLLIANNPTPEPTTATLSLLALMGLAARRRRKA